MYEAGEDEERGSKQIEMKNRRRFCREVVGIKCQNSSLTDKIELLSKEKEMLEENINQSKSSNWVEMMKIKEKR